MAEIQDINAYKKSRRRRKRVKRIIYLILIIGIVLGVYYAAQYYDILDGDGLPVIDSISPGTGFPVKLSGDKPQRIEPMDKSFAFLTDKQVIFYQNSNGKEQARYVHGFTNAVMDTGKDRILLYDVGSSRYKILSKDKELYSKELQEKIYLGKINSSGYFGLVTNSDRYASVLTVYDKYNDDIFTWSTSERITAMAFSGNGTKCAVATVDAENGKMLSNIYLLDYNSKKEMSKSVHEGSIVTELSYINDDVLVIGDNALWLINSNGETDELLSNDQEIAGIGNNAARYQFIAQGDPSVEISTLLTFDQNHQKIAELQFQEKIIQLYNTDEYFGVMTKAQIYIYDRNLDLIQEFDEVSDCQMFAIKNKKIYLVDTSAITQLTIDK